MSDAAQPAGWYPDPWYPSSVRWWDGLIWTEHAAPSAAPYGGPSQIYDAEKGASSARLASVGFLVRGAATGLQALFMPAEMARFWDELSAVFDTPTEPHSFGTSGIAALGQLSGLVALGGLILVIIWTYRATTNARALGLRTTYSPGWTVAGWIIPFANWFMPFQSVRDLFPDGHRARSRAGWWWACEMGSVVVVGVSYVVAIAVGGTAGTAVGCVAAALVAAAALLGVQLTRAADAVHAGIASGESPFPG